MASFYANYDYWNLDEEWFVAGYANQEGLTAAQFRPTRRTIIKAVEKLYRDTGELNTQELLDTEQSWHRQGGLV